MRVLLALLLSVTLVGADETTDEVTSLVPTSEWVSDIRTHLELAKIYNFDKKYTQALVIYQKIKSETLTTLEDQVDLAELAANLGYAHESRELFTNILQKNYEPEIRLRFAQAEMSWGDFYEAEKTFAELDPKQLVNTLIATDQLLEAENFALQELSSPEREANLATIKFLQHDYEAALRWVNQLLQNSSSEIKAYKTQKAAILLKLKNYEEALCLFMELNDDIGVGKTFAALGEVELAFTYWSKKLGDLSSPLTAQQLHSWAELYGELGDASRVQELYQEALELDPAYFPASIGLAEIYSSSLQYEEAANIYNQLLISMPRNPQLLLGHARVLAWHKDYLDSIKAYQFLIELNECNPIPKLEQARVAFWGKYYPLSMKIFQALLEGCLVPLRREEIYLERLARVAEWNWCFIEANVLYGKILALEPTNPLWQVEYAQSLCTIGLCTGITAYYEDIVEEAPLNTYVDLMLTRQRQKERVTCNLNYDYWQEIGYGDLSQIGRYEATFLVDVPLTCQHHLKVAEHRFLEHTFYDHHYHLANGQSVGWEGRFTPYFKALASVEEKEYLHQFNDTTTYLVTLDFNLKDCSNLLVGYTRRNELFNYFNLKQTTQGDIWWGSWEKHWNHAITSYSLYEHVSYSDSNTMQRAVVSGSYAFSNYPKVLKASLLAEWRNTDHTNIFIYNKKGKLINIIYPYWAPQDYYLGQFLLEWQHDYADLQFCNAPVRYYNVKLSVGTDTQDNPYCALKGEWVHEFFYHWRFSVAGLIHRSPQWNANGLWLSLGYTF